MVAHIFLIFASMGPPIALLGISSVTGDDTGMSRGMTRGMSRGISRVPTGQRAGIHKSHLFKDGRGLQF